MQVTAQFHYTVFLRTISGGRLELVVNHLALVTAIMHVWFSE